MHRRLKLGVKHLGEDVVPWLRRSFLCVLPNRSLQRSLLDGSRPSTYGHAEYLPPSAFLLPYMARSNPSEGADHGRSAPRRQSVRALARRADEFFMEGKTPTAMLQLFEDAGVEPPQEWLLEWGRTF